MLVLSVLCLSVLSKSNGVVMRFLIRCLLLLIITSLFRIKAPCDIVLHKTLLQLSA